MDQPAISIQLSVSCGVHVLKCTHSTPPGTASLNVRTSRSTPFSRALPLQHQTASTFSPGAVSVDCELLNPRRERVGNVSKPTPEAYHALLKLQSRAMLLWMMELGLCEALTVVAEAQGTAAEADSIEEGRYTRRLGATREHLFPRPRWHSPPQPSPPPPPPPPPAYPGGTLTTSVTHVSLLPTERDTARRVLEKKNGVSTRTTHGRV